MTDTTVPIPAPSSDGAWPSVLADYREACATLQREVDRAREQGADISPDVAASHGWAARALIETPATYAIQIGQKIRAADNLVNLSQLWADAEATCAATGTDQATPARVAAMRRTPRITSPKWYRRASQRRTR